MYQRVKPKPAISIPAKVWGQIRLLVCEFDTEVSWFGDISETENGYRINQIYLFPQEVSGATFRTDTNQVSEMYDSWYEQKLLSAQGKPIMQYHGHSHVAAGVTPSGEDIKYRKERKGINIYSIHNTQGQQSWEIWTDDIVMEMSDLSVHIEDEILSEKDFVKKPQVPAYGTWTKKGKKYDYSYQQQRNSVYDQRGFPQLRTEQSWYCLPDE